MWGWMKTAAIRHAGHEAAMELEVAGPPAQLSGDHATGDAGALPRAKATSFKHVRQRLQPVQDPAQLT